MTAMPRRGPRKGSLRREVRLELLSANREIRAPDISCEEHQQCITSAVQRRKIASTIPARYSRILFGM